jgi:predicted O-methyltransferase YrrM
MNPDISAALAAMDKVEISRLEYPGGGAMNEGSCRFLGAFARAIGARRVLEFGSGFTTLLLARELVPAGPEGYLLSIDDSPSDSAAARESVESSECPTKVEFRVAPLRPRLYGPRLLLSYDLPRGLLEALGPFDLALVDPPHIEYGREAVFYDVFDAVRPGGYIIFDDANADGAWKNSSRSWDAAYGGAIEPVLLEGIGDGLEVVEKIDDDVPARPPFWPSLEVSARTIKDYLRLLRR